MKVVTHVQLRTHINIEWGRCTSGRLAGSATSVGVAAGATARAQRRVVHVTAEAAYPPASHGGPDGCVDYGGVGVLDLVDHGCKNGKR